MLPLYQARAQQVFIHNATPAAVLDVLKGDLVPQGFSLRDANKYGALFALDRGNVVQSTGPIASVHAVIELEVRYRAKPNGLEVSASEEAVGSTGSSWLDFRRPVESSREPANLQQLLDSVRVTVETRQGRDSIVRVDSPAR